MTEKRFYRNIDRTPEKQRELEAIREKFQRDRPSLKDLLASGDAAEEVSQGEFLDLLALLAKLRDHRRRQGLSLADVSQRSGMDRAAVSRLENGVYVNPTVDTLYRYAAAVGADIGFTVRVG